MTTIIRKSLISWYPSRTLLVPLDRNRTQTNESSLPFGTLTESSLPYWQLHATGVIRALRPPSLNSRIPMAGLGGRTQFDNLEDESLKWTTEWEFCNNAMYAAAKASIIKLARLNREKIALLTR